MSEQYSRVNRMVTIRRRKEDWEKIAENLERVKNLLIVLERKYEVGSHELEQLNLLLNRLYEEIY